MQAVIMRTVYPFFNYRIRHSFNQLFPCGMLFGQRMISALINQISAFHCVECVSDFLTMRPDALGINKFIYSFSRFLRYPHIYCPRQILRSIPIKAIQSVL